MGITSNVSQYIERGLVRFDKVLSISLHARIPNLTHVYGIEKIHMVVAALLKSFQDSLNLIRPMNDAQLFECSHALVMTTEEDQLSIEDLVLFFKGAKEGKYGRILDRLDQQTVFEMLEQYRGERHRQYVRMKETRHLELKAIGPAERTNQADPIAQAMCNLTGRIHSLKEQLKEQKEINQASRL